MLVCLPGCSTVEPWQAGEHYKVNPQHEEQCANEGGCSLMTQAWFQLQMLRAYKAGQKSESEAADKPGSL